MSDSCKLLIKVASGLTKQTMTHLHMAKAMLHFRM
jgi:hypothetical protein